MAIRKKVENFQGITGEYSKISEISLAGHKLTGDLTLYLNLHHRNSGYAPLDNFKFEYFLTEEEKISNLVEVAYNKIMFMPQVEGEDGTLTDYPKGNLLKRKNGGDMYFCDGESI